VYEITELDTGKGTGSHTKYGVEDSDTDSKEDRQTEYDIEEDRTSGNDIEGSRTNSETKESDTEIDTDRGTECHTGCGIEGKD
jgi:hypothetical protein